MESLNKEFIINRTFDSRYVKNFINKVTAIKSDVYFAKDDRKINAKSIIGLLSLGLSMGDKIEIYVSGSNKDLLKSDMIKVIEILGE